MEEQNMIIEYLGLNDTRYLRHVDNELVFEYTMILGSNCLWSQEELEAIRDKWNISSKHYKIYTPEESLILMALAS